MICNLLAFYFVLQHYIDMSGRLERFRWPRKAIRPKPQTPLTGGWIAPFFFPKCTQTTDLLVAASAVEPRVQPTNVYYTLGRHVWMGWLTGLEPASSGATIRCST